MFKLTIECADKNELITYAKSTDLSAFIFDFSEKLRVFQKHGLPKLTNTPYEAVDIIRESFYQMLDEYNIKIDGDY